MKRLLMIGCAAAAMAIASSALAATWTDENGAVWTYTGTSKGVTITKYAAPDGDVVIPPLVAGRPVLAIGSSAFKSCPWIRSVKIPDSVTSIGSSAFASCAWLESVTFPPVLDKIGVRAFFACSRLSEIKNMVSVNSISSDAFKGCRSLGEGVIINGGWVLVVNGECPSNVAIPEGTVGIVGGVFGYCTSLQTMRIPKSLARVGALAFNGCSGLREFVVDPENPYFYSENGMLISKTNNRLVCGVNGDVRVPDGIVEIGSNAFSGFQNLTSVVIPPSVKRIGDNAFQDCKALTHVEIPESVLDVGVNAFVGCDGFADAEAYSLGRFNGNAKHVYAGIVYSLGNSVGLVQITTAKATSRGVRVKGVLVLEDGKKRAIQPVQVPIENGVLKIETSVVKLDDMSLVIGLNGFKGSIGEKYLVQSGDTSGYSALNGTIAKMYVDAATGKFKTSRAKLTGFSSPNHATGEIQEKDKRDLSFSAEVQ